MLLKNCRIIENENEVVRDVLIEDGKIKEISENIDYDGKVIDVSGKYVLPGVIDPHVHFREPGQTYKEDFLTGSIAAAAGGVTTVLDMPNNKPPTFTIKLLDEKRELAKKSIVNYGFHFGSSADNNIEEIKKANNIPSVKVYMNATTGNLLVEDDNLIKEIFANSKFVSVHAEEEMADKAIRFFEEHGQNGLYICHVSLKSEIDAIAIAKNNNKKEVFAEVAPHHLFFTKEDDKTPLTKIKPFFKTQEDQNALWQAIEDGIVDTIGTDHAPHTLEEKDQENPPTGFPSIETRLPLMLDAVNKGRISLKKVIELCSNNPAKIFGIKNKGFLKQGYDADIVIVDMNLEKEVKNEELLTKQKWTPYKGMTLKGWPIMTIVNGNIVFDNGKINDIKGKEVSFNERKTSG